LLIREKKKMGALVENDLWFGNLQGEGNEEGSKKVFSSKQGRIGSVSPH